jgi:hypothetical protein
MAIKNIEVTDPIVSKEWMGDATMEFPHIG